MLAKVLAAAPSYHMTHPQHAILIPGLLRCVDNIFLDFLDSASQFAKIFVVTEKSYASTAAELLKRYDAVILFDSEACSDLDVNHSFFSGALGQFLKLEIALAALMEWEIRNEHQFSYIHRFRSDVLYTCAFPEYVSQLLSHELPCGSLLNRYDFNFSGRRSDVYKLRGICTYVEKFRRDKYFLFLQLSSIDVDALHRSVEMTPFPSSFPVGIVETEADIDNFHNMIRSRFANYIDASLSFSQSLSCSDDSEKQVALIISNSILARTYSGRYSPIFPEHMFAKYVNSLGLAVLPYSQSDLNLRFSRFATTPFTRNLFDDFQCNCFTCLDNQTESRWSDQLNSFLSAGGRKEDFLKVLININLFKLSDDQCRGLYSLIDILDGASWIALCCPWFLENLKQRGLGLPVSLQDHAGP